MNYLLHYIKDSCKFIVILDLESNSFPLNLGWPLELNFTNHVTEVMFQDFHPGLL